MEPRPTLADTLAAEEVSEIVKRWILLIALSVVLTACGGGDDAEGNELAGLIGEKIWLDAQEDVTAGGTAPDLSRAEADCFGRAMVDTVGYESFRDAGITVEAVSQDPELVREPFETLDLSTDAGLELFDALQVCYDFEAAFAGLMAGAGGLSQASARCYVDGLFGNESFRLAIAESMVGGSGTSLGGSDPVLASLAADLMGECLTDEELARFGGL